MKYGQKSTRSSTVQGQAPQKNLNLRSCVSADVNPVPFPTPWPCVVLPTLSIKLCRCSGVQKVGLGAKGHPLLCLSPPHPPAKGV